MRFFMLAAIIVALSIALIQNPSPVYHTQVRVQSSGSRFRVWVDVDLGGNKTNAQFVLASTGELMARNVFLGPGAPTPVPPRAWAWQPWAADYAQTWKPIAADVEAALIPRAPVGTGNLMCTLDSAHRVMCWCAFNASTCEYVLGSTTCADYASTPQCYTPGPARILPITATMLTASPDGIMHVFADGPSGRIWTLRSYNPAVTHWSGFAANLSELNVQHTPLHAVAAWALGPDFSHGHIINAAWITAACTGGGLLLSRNASSSTRILTHISFTRLPPGRGLSTLGGWPTWLDAAGRVHLYMGQGANETGCLFSGGILAPDSGYSVWDHEFAIMKPGTLMAGYQCVDMLASVQEDAILLVFKHTLSNALQIVSVGESALATRWVRSSGAEPPREPVYTCAKWDACGTSACTAAQALGESNVQAAGNALDDYRVHGVGLFSNGTYFEWGAETSDSRSEGYVVPAHAGVHALALVRGDTGTAFDAAVIQ